MTKEPISITGLWLRTSGGKVQVLIEHEGQWKLVNDEPLTEGEYTVISHITEPCGMEKAPLDPLTHPSLLV